jgi:hypothetical protein
VGRTLNFDPATEQVIGDQGANHCATMIADTGQASPFRRAFKFHLPLVWD